MSSDSELTLLAVVLLGALVLLIIFGVAALFAGPHRRGPERRGFEVKLDAGDEPAMKRKENDHG